MYLSFLRGLIIAILLIFPQLGLSQQTTPELETRKQAIQAIEDSATEESIARKERSIAILKAEGIPFIKHLPVIETEVQSIRRSKEEILKRAIALMIVGFKGDIQDHDLTVSMVEALGADAYFTPEELAFVHNPAPTEHDSIQLSWRSEGALVMLWAAGLIDDLGRPDKVADVLQIDRLVGDVGFEELMRKAKPRSQAEILDAADLIYRYHWAIVQARLDSEEIETLDADVVFERHYALNWLIGYMGQDWDDISTDT